MAEPEESALLNQTSIVKHQRHSIKKSFLRVIKLRNAGKVEAGNHF